jgi:hypothetical protein
VQDNFDPYSQWLEIPQGPRPPSYYRLLGLAALESHAQTIAAAADAAMAKLHKIQPGTYLAQWGQLIGEVAAAKTCLLDPAQRAAYDAQLLGREEPAVPPPMVSVMPPPALAPPVVAGHTPVLPTPLAAVSPVPSTPPRGLSRFSSDENGTVPFAATGAASLPAVEETGWQSWITTAALVFFGVALGGAVAVLFIPRRDLPAAAAPEPKPPAVAQAVPVTPERPAVSKPAAPIAVAPSTSPPSIPVAKPEAKPEPKPSAAPPPPAAARPAPRPVAIPEAAKPQPLAGPRPKPPREAPQADDDPAKRAAYTKAVAEVRLAVWRRDLAAARQHLKTAKANRQSPADEKEFARLDVMLDNLEQFWKGLAGAVAKLQAGDELELKDNRVAVIEASRDELLVQIYGRPERYRIVALPIALVKALVDQSFASTPGSKVIVATFLAMDREGDRGRARQLFEEASRAGESLGRDLLPELDVPLPDIRGGAGSTVHGLGQ